MKTWETRVFESLSGGNAVSVHTYRVEAETETDAREKILAELEGEQRDRWAERGKLEEVEPYNQETLDWIAALKWFDEREDVRQEAKQIWDWYGEWTGEQKMALRNWLIERWRTEGLTS